MFDNQLFLHLFDGIYRSATASLVQIMQSEIYDSAHCNGLGDNLLVRNTGKDRRNISFLFNTGHGKLIMRDGSYYEGSFENGEIKGEGVRYWSHDGKLYRGSFSSGECHGQGVVEYKDGSTYEGQFEHNKREGNLIIFFFIQWSSIEKKSST